MIEKGQRLHPGDILRNDWTSEQNPYYYTMYIKRGRVGNQKTIDCVGYDGGVAHHRDADNRLVVVGHLKEYDDYKIALLRLRAWEGEEDGC